MSGETWADRATDGAWSRGTAGSTSTGNGSGLAVPWHVRQSLSCSRVIPRRLAPTSLRTSMKRAKTAGDDAEPCSALEATRIFAVPSFVNPRADNPPMTVRF